MKSQNGSLPADIGAHIGQAIARDVQRDNLPREWSGLDPQDADRIVAAGYAFGSQEYDAAEQAAEAEYQRLVG